MSRASYIISRIAGVMMAAGFLLPAFSASALSVNPAIHDVVVDPGKVETRTITIENDESTMQTYVFSIQKFIPKGESGQQEFLDPSDTAGLPEWMFVDKPEVTLAPGRSTVLQIAIRVPSQAPAGGYYAALFLARKQSANEQVAMLPRLGILFFVQVNGALNERVRLKDFSTDATSYEHLPVGFRATLVNEGNVHIVPDGTITVKNFLGSTVAKAPLNPGGVRLLPGSQRALSAVWRKAEPRQGTGFFHGLTEELSNFAIGPYTATLDLSGRGISQPVRQAVSFAVWPWRTMSTFGILVVALVVLFFVFKKLAVLSATAKSAK